MIPYGLLLLTLCIALCSIVLLTGAINRGVAKAWHRVFLSAAIAAFIYLYGAWIFLSIFLKYLFVLAYIATGIIASHKKNRVSLSAYTRGRVLLNLFFSFVFIVLVVLYYTGTTGKPYGIAHLRLPFRKGSYFVFQGGKGLPTNVFHSGLHGAVFAMDIIKLNAAGNRAGRIFSTRLEDYEIFNDTIYSPCAGVVAHTARNNPDNIPPDRRRGPTNTNHVLLETDSFYVFMGHMKYDRVFVSQGDTVLAGQPLGLAGNSGFSIEPHLHIQAHARTASGLPWYRQPPLLMEFDGKNYLLFEVIKAGL